MELVVRRGHFVYARYGAFHLGAALPTLRWSFFRCVEALTRAGEYDRPLLQRAIAMFEVRNHYVFPLNLLTQRFLEGFPAVL